MPQSYGIGVIGFGNRIGTLVTELLATDPRIQLLAICDPNPTALDAARRLSPRVQSNSTPAQLLDNNEVGWVLVGSPNILHREHTVAALRAGRHVFCEKPLATTLSDCLAIRDTVAQTGRTFFFGLVLRYAALYARIRQLLDERRIGEIISLEFNETLGFNHGGFIHQDWRRLRANAGTHLLEKCCHDIDIVNWMVGSRARFVASFGGLRYFVPHNRHLAEKIGPSPAGRPAFQEWPASTGDPFTADKDIVDHQVAIIEFENGVRASFHTNCVAAIPERRLLLLGTEGAVRADLHTGRVELQQLGWNEPRVVYSVSSNISNHFGADTQLVQAMAASITRGHPPLTTIEHALDSAITCLGIDAAMDERRVVDLRSMWQQAGRVT